MHPILVHWGPISLHTYGLMVAIGFLAAFWVARIQFERLHLPVADLDALTFWLMVGGLLGARALYFAVDGFEELKGDPFSFFRIWEGGLVFYGGVIAGVIVLAIYKFRRRIPFLTLTDALAPPLLLGHAIGRLGCLAAGCCYGKATDGALCVIFRDPESLAPKFTPLQPTQIYESAGNALLFAGAMILAKRHPRRGALTAGYLLGYGAFRFGIEFLRGDDRGAFIAGLSPSQWIAMALIIAGVLVGGMSVSAKSKKSETLRVGAADEGVRLDRFLVGRYPDWSRTALQRLINHRHVMVDGHPVSPNHLLHIGQSVVLTWPVITAPAPREHGACPFPILYEDDELFALDKPAGLVVHPAAGHNDGDTLVEIVRPLIAGGPWPDEIRPGLVHRLDRDTSGVIVMAKTIEAHAKLSQQFSKRQAKKTYLALVKGVVESKEGVLESHLARHPGKRQRFAVSAKGRWASTRFRVLERFGDASYLELIPLTGRTHQIRVHLSSYGHPIIADHVYGTKEKEFESVKRHLLHASTLELTHPKTGERLRFEAPLPADFQGTLKLLRSRE